MKNSNFPKEILKAQLTKKKGKLASKYISSSHFFFRRTEDRNRNLLGFLRTYHLLQTGKDLNLHGKELPTHIFTDEITNLKDFRVIQHFTLHVAIIRYVTYLVLFSYPSFAVVLQIFHCRLAILNIYMIYATQWKEGCKRISLYQCVPSK